MDERENRARNSYEEREEYEDETAYEGNPDDEAQDEEYEEEYGEEEYDEEEYDENVFSLDEDLRRERMKQWVQYLLVALCAAAVVGAALYGSIVLTHQRMERQKSNIVVEQPTGPSDPSDDPSTTGAPAVPKTVAAWPESAFPDVPVLQSEAYETTARDGYAQVVVPSATGSNFDDYIAELVEAGAAIYVRTPRLSVLNLDGVEIHLINTNQQCKAVLCDEPEADWDDSEYAAFLLPQVGKVVAVEEGVGAGSRVLTYRGATVLDALGYTGSLLDAGWAISGSLEPTNNIFSATYKKNNLQITVDYFSTSDNFLVKLDYLS